MKPHELSRVLFRFSQMGQVEAVKKLLKMGVYDSINWYSAYPFAQASALETATYYNHIEIVKLLLLVRDYRGSNSLKFSIDKAKRWGSLEIFTLLNEYEQRR